MALGGGETLELAKLVRAEAVNKEEYFMLANVEKKTGSRKG
jgi:alcohol dehydrogenase class IV